MEKVLSIIATLMVICTIFLGAIAFKAVQSDLGNVKLPKIERQAQKAAQQVPFCFRLETLQGESADCADPNEGVIEMELPANNGETIELVLDLNQSRGTAKIVSPGVFPPAEDNS